MTPYEIPLSPSPQSFLISLLGVQYRLTLRYQATVNAGWTLDIATAAGANLVCGIPLVTGEDLLVQYEYLNIGVPLYVATDGDLDAVPTFTNLGDPARLYFTTEP
jgi:hypothetical protein